MLFSLQFGRDKSTLFHIFQCFWEIAFDEVHVKMLYRVDFVFFSTNWLVSAIFQTSTRRHFQLISPKFNRSKRPLFIK